jgi:hypothetical protein
MKRLSRRTLKGQIWLVVAAVSGIVSRVAGWRAVDVWLAWARVPERF